MIRLAMFVLLVPFAAAFSQDILVPLAQYEANSIRAAISDHRRRANTVLRTTGLAPERRREIGNYLADLDVEEMRIDRLGPDELSVAMLVRGAKTAGFSSVGALIYNQETVCSGTLVGTQSFLTARHCFEPSKDPDDFAVYLQHAGILTAQKIVFPNDIDIDLALVKLHRPVSGIAPSQLAVDISTTGQFKQIIGFGVTSEGALNSGIKRQGQIEVAPCSEVGNEEFLCWKFELPFEEPVVQGANICFRDSGGPVGIASSAELQIEDGIAVRISPELSCQDGSQSWSLAVQPLNIWLTSTVTQAELTAPADLPVCCDDGVDVRVFEGTLPKLGGVRFRDHGFEVPEDVRVVRVALNAFDIPQSNLDLSVRSTEELPSSPGCKAIGRYESCEYEFSSGPPLNWAARIENTSGGQMFYQLVVTMFK